MELFLIILYLMFLAFVIGLFVASINAALIVGTIGGIAVGVYYGVYNYLSSLFTNLKFKK